MIYRRCPVGLPLPAALAKAGNRQDNGKLNRLLQELAWEAVVGHPLSGVEAGSPSRCITAAGEPPEVARVAHTLP